jgi:Ser/Thr protein kinase RdoA (MazF antagonist)
MSSEKTAVARNYALTFREDGRVNDPVAAAVRVVSDLGLEVGEPVVLRDLRSTLVDLPPSGVLARVWRSGVRDPVVVECELAVTAHLAERGAAVAPPYDAPGPFAVGDWRVTLWRRLDHDPDRELDGHLAGEALREVHDLLADHPVDGLPHFARLDEVRRILATLDPGPEIAADLVELVDRAEEVVVRLDVPLQPVHGDAWLGNVLRTPDGPVWTDFELLCLGPRELDLACNEGAARHRGRTPADDAFLAGYGPYDPDLLARVQPLELVPLTAWTFELARDHPEHAEMARTRLAWALAGLREL